MNSLVVEVSNLSAKERVLLEECKELLSMITTMQVNFASVKEALKLEVLLIFL